MTSTFPLLDKNLKLNLEERFLSRSHESLIAREADPIVGCRCDRWGHPCPTCIEDKSFLEQSRQRPAKGEMKQNLIWNT